MTCRCDNMNQTHSIVSTSLMCDLTLKGEDAHKKNKDAAKKKKPEEKQRKGETY